MVSFSSLYEGVLLMDSSSTIDILCYSSGIGLGTNSLDSELLPQEHSNRTKMRRLLTINMSFIVDTTLFYNYFRILSVKPECEQFGFKKRKTDSYFSAAQFRETCLILPTHGFVCAVNGNRYTFIVGKSIYGFAI